jgi:hypothetical protein
MLTRSPARGSGISLLHGEVTGWEGFQTRAARVGGPSAAGISTGVRLNRIIEKRLRDTDGNAIGDVNAAIAVNVGEPGGSETHVRSHSRIVQRTRGAQAETTTSESRTRPAPPPEADEPKEDA